MQIVNKMRFYNPPSPPPRKKRSHADMYKVRLFVFYAIPY